MTHLVCFKPGGPTKTATRNTFRLNNRVQDCSTFKKVLFDGCLFVGLFFMWHDFEYQVDLKVVQMGLFLKIWCAYAFLDSNDITKTHNKKQNSKEILGHSQMRMCHLEREN